MRPQRHSLSPDHAATPEARGFVSRDDEAQPQIGRGAFYGKAEPFRTSGGGAGEAEILWALARADERYGGFAFKQSDPHPVVTAI